MPSMGTVLMGLKSPVLKPEHDENILMKIPAEAKVRRVISGLKEPTEGRQTAARLPRRGEA